MRKITSILLILTLGIAMVSAQDSKVMTGVMAYDASDLAKAIDALETATSNPEKIRKTKNLSKAHLYLAKAYNAVNVHPLLKADYPDAAMKAYKNWKKAVEIDTEKKWEKDLAVEKISLFNTLYNAGINAYNVKDYETAAMGFDAAAEMDPSKHTTFFMAGISNYFLQDTAKAAADWMTAIETYEKNDAPATDSMMASAYRMLAHYKAFGSEKDVKKSLEIIEKGRQHFEWDENLQLLELDIYNNNPEYFEEAKSKFVAAIADNPENKSIKSAYARLLRESGQEDKANEIYMEILKKDPLDFVSNANLGDYYVTQAKVLNQRLLDEDNLTDEKRESMESETNELLKKSYGYYKSAFESKPDNQSLVGQLLYISSFVPELLPELSKWKKVSEELKSNNAPSTNSGEKPDGGE